MSMSPRPPALRRCHMSSAPRSLPQAPGPAGRPAPYQPADQPALSAGCCSEGLGVVAADLLQHHVAHQLLRQLRLLKVELEVACRARGSSSSSRAWWVVMAGVVFADGWQRAGRQAPAWQRVCGSCDTGPGPHSRCFVDRPQRPQRQQQQQLGATHWARRAPASRRAAAPARGAAAPLPR